MRTIRLHAAGDIRMHEEDQPVPEDGEALVRVGAVGLCGSDLLWYKESGIGDARLDHSLILGHEFAGWINDDGSLAAVEPAIPCGRCESCQEGNNNLCTRLKFAGHGEQDGALREYIAWPEKNLFRLPNGISAVEGAMLEPLGVAIYATDLAKMRPRMEIGIFGCGPIGLMILQLVRNSGPRFILATDRLKNRIEAAARFGADEIVEVDDSGRLPEGYMERRGRGLDLVFEAAGDNSAVESAIEAVRPGGQVILVGIPSSDQTEFRSSTARRKGLNIQFVRRMKNTYPRAIRLVAQEQIDVLSLVSHQYTFDQAKDAFRTAVERTGLKVVLTP